MNVVESFRELSYQSQRDMLIKLENVLSESHPILNHKSTPETCPLCGHDKIYKHGAYKNGGSRYRCVSCRKTFNELTGTSLHGIKKKGQFDRFIGLMLEGHSIRRIAKTLELSTKTVFEWRHKVLASLEGVFTKEFKGIVETDDTFFRFNQKGTKKSKLIIFPKKKRGISNQKVNVLVTTDRYKTFGLGIAGVGRLSQDKLKLALDHERLNDEVVMCSDNHNAMKKYFKQLGLEHQYFTVSKDQHIKDGIYHINNVNATISRLKKWVGDNFSSVSTKYLENYLNYFGLVEILKHKRNKNDKTWDYMLVANDSINRFRGIENKYQDFITSNKIA